MSDQRALRAGVVAIAPVLLVAALSYHPYLSGRQPNYDEIAEAVISDPTRWGIAHLSAGIASAVLAVAFLAVRRHLQEAGEDRWSAAALPFVIIGSTIYAMLPGMEFAVLATDEAGGDVEQAQEALVPWFVSLLLSGAAIFAVGMVCFAIAVYRNGLLGPQLGALVAGALVVMALSRFVPLSAVQFYVHGAAALVALLPLAHSIWKHPRATTVVTPGALKPT
jgi:hypothetical protein